MRKPRQSPTGRASPAETAPARPAGPRLPAAGVDPGRTGAAVLLDAPDRLLAVVAWKPCTVAGHDRYRVMSARVTPAGLRTDARIIPSRSGAVGAEIVRVLGEAGGPPPATLACEDVYLGKNAQTAIELAKWAGGVVAPAEHLYGRDARWIKPDEWRAFILGLRRGTRREVAKQASLRYVPQRVAGLPDVLRVFGDLDHLSDAAGVACWAALSP